MAFAAATAMACGIDTEVALTQDRLTLLRGYKNVGDRRRDNLAIQFPISRKVPPTLADWAELNAHPERLTNWVDADADDDD